MSDTPPKNEAELSEKSIFLSIEYLGTIHYFENVNIHTFLDNNQLKELCKKDLKNLRNGIQKRPYNIQDELDLSGFYEAPKTELNNLFETKFKQAIRFRTKETFAKHEHDYMRGIWSNTDILKRIPITKQWLKYLYDLYYDADATNEGLKRIGNKETKKLKDFLLNAKNFNDKEVKTIEEQLKKHFEKPIKEAYNSGKLKGAKQPFVYLILSLGEMNIIDINNSEFAQLVRYFKKLFFEDHWENNIENDQTNFARTIQRGGLNKGSKVYKETILPNKKAFEIENFILLLKLKK